MSDTTDTQGNETTNVQQPPFTIVHQYLKDLSVEVPNAPQVFQTAPTNPQLSVNVDVTVQQLAEKDFEVSLHLQSKSEQDEVVQHQTELVYSAIVTMGDVTQDILQAIMFVEIPRLTFPFARQVMTNSIQSTGFPPVNLAPIDFVDMFRQRVANAKAEAENQGDTSES